METLYDILEVSRKASPEVIDKAYKTLAKKYHPDLQSEENRVQTEEKMKKINEAYAILNDPEKRKEYDRKLDMQEQQNIEKVEKNEYKENITEDDLQYLNWQKAYSILSKREQIKLKRKIEKEANEEYRKKYENYFKSLGYKVEHHWTKKEIIVLLSIIVVLILVSFIIWKIPKTHEWLLNLYNNNMLVKIIVNIIMGIFNGIKEFFKIIFKGVYNK